MTRLDDLLASKRKSPSSPDDGAAVAHAVAEDPAPEGEDGQDDAKYTTIVTTPSGIEIRFIGGEKHDYSLRLRDAAPDAPWGEWTPVPSVSDLKDVLDKPAIPRWAADEVAKGALYNETWQAIRHKSGDDAAIAYLKGLPWNKRDKAAARGTSVHNGMEYWAMSGELPKSEVYDEVERPFVDGLNAFLTESGIVCHQAEVMVGSIESGFAGRFDLDGVLMEDVELVCHLTPKGRGTKKKVFPAGRALFDLKTSSGVYLDMFFQLEYYNYAYVEDGYGEPFPNKYIVRVTDDGRYEVKDSLADWIDCLHLKGVYDGLQRMKGKA